MPQFLPGDTAACIKHGGACHPTGADSRLLEDVVLLIGHIVMAGVLVAIGSDDLLNQRGWLLLGSLILLIGHMVMAGVLVAIGSGDLLKQLGVIGCVHVYRLPFACVTRST